MFTSKHLIFLEILYKIDILMVIALFIVKILEFFLMIINSIQTRQLKLNYYYFTTFAKGVSYSLIHMIDKTEWLNNVFKIYHVVLYLTGKIQNFENNCNWKFQIT